MSKLQVRINGRGNAWPVIMGQEHPFYNRQNIEDLSNASCSLVCSNQKNPTAKEIEWEILIDAGHGAAQYLIKNYNRIPEALFLTHPHIDHTLGMDWIIQSYYKTYRKKYPVYATQLCFERTMVAFPHLIDFIEFRELMPYQEVQIQEIKDVSVIPFPVYHGQSAVGASMFLFKVSHNNIIKVLFTGDILCPLLRNSDLDLLHNIDLLVTDANNRFPYPKSNHWSLINGVDQNPSNFLEAYKKEITIGMLLYPHINKSSANYYRSFDYFLNQEIKIDDLDFSVFDFVKRIQPAQVALIHYSGNEDENYYDEKCMSESELQDWINDLKSRNKLKTSFLVPYVGQHIKIIKY